MMALLRGINLAVAFLLELAVLVGVGYAGFQLSGVLAFVVGLGGPVLLALLWGAFAAPKASRPLHGAANVAFQATWFACGAVALVLAGQLVLGVSLAAVYLLNSACLLATR
jgi:hypothetical protein